MPQGWQRDSSGYGVTGYSSCHGHSSSMCIPWECGGAGCSNMRGLSFGNADSSFSAGSGPSGRAGPWSKQAQLPEGIEIQCWAGGSWGYAVQTYAKNYFQNHPECQKEIEVRCSTGVKWCGPRGSYLQSMFFSSLQTSGSCSVLTKKLQIPW